MDINVFHLYGVLEVKDLQARFDVAKAYREHVDQVGDDRALEDWVQATCLSSLFWFKHSYGFIKWVGG